MIHPKTTSNSRRNKKQIKYAFTSTASGINRGANEIHAFLNKDAFFQLSLSVAKLSHKLNFLNVTKVLVNTYKTLKTSLIFTICLDLGLLMPCLCDLFFIFIILFTMINHIILWIQTHLFFFFFFFKCVLCSIIFG